MCLLIVVAQSHPAFPLVVGANRDEMFDRPATPMTVLDEANPRILGGRDERGGGTWLAVNEFGVIAGLTNRPPGTTVAAPRRSRGGLPLALARHPTAAAAVEDFARRYRPVDYNPAWLLVGDRDSLFAVDMTDGDEPAVTQLPPGLHVLKNGPLGAPSAKVARAQAVLGDVAGYDGGELEARIKSHLGDHEVTDQRGVFSAACVHADGFGTRWSALVTVPPDRAERPRFEYADGPPCRTPYGEATALW